MPGSSAQSPSVHLHHQTRIISDARCRNANRPALAWHRDLLRHISPSEVAMQQRHWPGIMRRALTKRHLLVLTVWLTSVDAGCCPTGKARRRGHCFRNISSDASLSTDGESAEDRNDVEIEWADGTTVEVKCPAYLQPKREGKLVRMPPRFDIVRRHGPGATARRIGCRNPTSPSDGLISVYSARKRKPISIHITRLIFHSERPS